MLNHSSFTHSSFSNYVADFRRLKYCAPIEGNGQEAIPVVLNAVSHFQHHFGLCPDDHDELTKHARVLASFILLKQKDEEENSLLGVVFE